MREICRMLPNESIVYLGDTARVPYGNKSRDTVIRFSLENAQHLLKHSIKALIVACNTATAYALESLIETIDIPVIGVIEPGVAAAVKASATGHIAVLGTRGTIHSGAYQNAIQARHAGAVVYPIACPLFVSLVEEGFINHCASTLIVEEYLRPLQDSQVDTVILGCTHYPLLREVIQAVLGPHITIIDSARVCADAVKAIVQLAITSSTSHRFLVSDDPHHFRQVGSSILGSSISEDKIFLTGCGLFETRKGHKFILAPKAKQWCF